MPRLTSKDEHKIGLKVKLTHPQKHYILSPSNPFVGSEYECVGKIIAVKEQGTCPIRVKWDSGYSNAYHMGTLSLCGENENYISIWED